MHKKLLLAACLVFLTSTSPLFFLTPYPTKPNTALAASCTGENGEAGTCTASATDIACPTGTTQAISKEPCPNGGHYCVSKTEGTGAKCQADKGTCVSNSIGGSSNCPSGTSPVSVANDCPSFKSCCVTTDTPPTPTTPAPPRTPLEECKVKCYASGTVTTGNSDLDACVKKCNESYPINPTPTDPTPTPQTGKGLIPCGHGDNPADACTLCDFIIGFRKLIDLASELLITVAVTGIFISGVMYIVSAGSQLTEQAKKFLSASLIGFAIVLSAWLLVNVVMWALSFNPEMSIGKKDWHTFECTSQSASSSTTPTGSTIAAK